MTSNFPSMISADKERLMRSIAILVSNSLENTKIGEISIDCTFDEATDMMTVAIQDSGIGLSNSKQLSIFNLFKGEKELFQVNFLSQGLEVCKMLMDQMNGTMKVQSLYQKGSRFGFSM